MTTNTNNVSVSEMNAANMESLAKEIRKDLNGPNFDLLLWNLLSKRTGIIESPTGSGASFLPLVGTVPAGGEYQLQTNAMVDFMPRRLIIAPVPFLTGISDVVVRPEHWVVNDMRCGKEPVIWTPGPVSGSLFAADAEKHESLRWKVLHVGMLFSLMVSHVLPASCKFMGVLVGETPKARP